VSADQPCLLCAQELETWQASHYGQGARAPTCRMHLLSTRQHCRSSRPAAADLPVRNTQHDILRVTLPAWSGHKAKYMRMGALLVGAAHMEGVGRASAGLGSAAAGAAAGCGAAGGGGASGAASSESAAMAARACSISSARASAMHPGRMRRMIRPALLPACRAALACDVTCAHRILLCTYIVHPPGRSGAHRPCQRAAHSASGRQRRSPRSASR